MAEKHPLRADLEPFDDDPQGPASDHSPTGATTDPPPLDAEDLDLGLRYLTDYRVIAAP